MKDFRILILDDMEERHLKLRSFAIGAEIDSVQTAAQAIELLEKHDYNQIFLDHDLADEHYLEGYKDPDCPVGKFDETTGYAVAKWLAEHHDKNSNAEIIIHSCNAVGGERMRNLLVDAKRKTMRIPYDVLVELALIASRRRR